jgi:hypothetical protein
VLGPFKGYVLKNGVEFSFHELFIGRSTIAHLTNCEGWSINVTSLRIDDFHRKTT